MDLYPDKLGVSEYHTYFDKFHCRIYLKRLLVCLSQTILLGTCEKALKPVDRESEILTSVFNGTPFHPHISKEVNQIVVWNRGLSVLCCLYYLLLTVLRCMV